MGWFDSDAGEDDEAEQRQPRDPFGRIMAEPLFDAFRVAWKAGAGLFDLFGSEPIRIEKPVGPDAPNRRPDVAKVDTFLDRTGHLDLARTEGPTGYFGSRVDQGIRGFQKDNALKVDGLINPDGETLQRLGALLSGREPSLQPTVSSSILRPASAQTEAPPERPRPLYTQATASVQARVADWLGRRGTLLVGKDPAASSSLQRAAAYADGTESAPPPASSPLSGSRGSKAGRSRTPRTTTL